MVGALLLAALPSAPARMAVYALTMACTSAAVSARAPSTKVLFSAELMAETFVPTTPVTPASAYSAGPIVASLAESDSAAALIFCRAVFGGSVGLLASPPLPPPNASPARAAPATPSNMPLPSFAGLAAAGTEPSNPAV